MALIRSPLGVEKFRYINLLQSTAAATYVSLDQVASVGDEVVVVLHVPPLLDSDEMFRTAEIFSRTRTR